MLWSSHTISGCIILCLGAAYFIGGAISGVGAGVFQCRPLTSIGWRLNSNLGASMNLHTENITAEWSLIFIPELGASMNLHTENITAEWSLIFIPELGAFPLISKRGSLLLFVGESIFCLGASAITHIQHTSLVFALYIGCCINIYISEGNSQRVTSLIGGSILHRVDLFLLQVISFHCTLL